MGQRLGKHVGARVVAAPIPPRHRSPGGHPADGGKRLCKRAEVQVDARLHAEVLARAPPCPSHDAEPVRHRRRTGARRTAPSARPTSASRAQVALHPEDALGDDEDAALAVLSAAFRWDSRSFMSLCLNGRKRPACARKDRGVDHGGVGEGIDDHDVIRPDERGHGAQDAEVAIVEDDRRRPCRQNAANFLSSSMCSVRVAREHPRPHGRARARSGAALPPRRPGRRDGRRCRGSC